MLLPLYDVNICLSYWTDDLPRITEINETLAHLNDLCTGKIVSFSRGVCVCACMCACMCGCVRACVRVCVCPRALRVLVSAGKRFVRHRKTDLLDNDERQSAPRSHN